MSRHDPESDYQVLWDAVQNEVPALLATVERMIKESA
jgi:hypothetical protein